MRSRFTEGFVISAMVAIYRDKFDISGGNETNYSVEIFVENIEDEAVLGRGNNNSDDIVQNSYLYPRNQGIKFKAKF